jgi:hypothetical protein
VGNPLESRSLRTITGDDKATPRRLWKRSEGSDKAGQILFRAECCNSADNELIILALDAH